MRTKWDSEGGKKTHIYWASALCQAQTRCSSMTVSKKIQGIFSPKLSFDLESFALHSGPYNVSYVMECFLLFYFIFFSFIWDRVSLCCPGWSAVLWSWLSATSACWSQAIHLLQPPIRLQAWAAAPGLFAAFECTVNALNKSITMF